VTGRRTLGYLTLNAGPLETVEAAAAAGFESVGIRITGRRIADEHPKVIGNLQMIRALRQRVADAGMVLSNVSAYHFYPDVRMDELDRAMEAIIELRCGILVSNSYHPDEASYVAALQRLCATGRSAGVRVAVEFMRYSAVKSLGDALRIIEQVGAPNIGVLIDALHLARSGGSPADIGKLDPASIVFAQLCDGKQVDAAMTEEQLRHEARTGRLYPGDGCLPLREFLEALPPGTEIEYEVPRQDLAGLTLAERAKVAHSVFNSYLDAAAPTAAPYAACVLPRP
jgi:sugar phosphate isomerase/epimerase